jgi:hypothetical protein
MSYISRNRPVHAERLERFLGREAIARAQQAMTEGGGKDKRWYGDPIYLIDVPGNVWVTADGDFHGKLPVGFGAFACVWDVVESRIKRIVKEAGRQHKHPLAAAGFASISDALARASSGGNRRYLNGGMLQKAGTTGVVGATNTLWAVGAFPAAGANGSAAPGGRAPTSATTGAMGYANPSSGTLHLTGAIMQASVVNNMLMLYDRIFDVAKTMNSTATEAVSGTPSRYQSTTTTAEDHAGSNFLFVECTTALAATAHNWTTCTYTDQAGGSSTLPSLTGNSGNIINRLDMPTGSWFAPLETGDLGVRTLTQMQCSAAVATGAINFVIGHPIGFMMFPTASVFFPFDWLTNMDQAPRIFDSACLALLEVVKPATGATSYTGLITATGAAP